MVFEFKNRIHVIIEFRQPVTHIRKLTDSISIGHTLDSDAELIETVSQVPLVQYSLTDGMMYKNQSAFGARFVLIRQSRNSFCGIIEVVPQPAIHPAGSPIFIGEEQPDKITHDGDDQNGYNKSIFAGIFNLSRSSLLSSTAFAELLSCSDW